MGCSVVRATTAINWSHPELDQTPICSDSVSADGDATAVTRLDPVPYGPSHAKFSATGGKLSQRLVFAASHSFVRSALSGRYREVTHEVPATVPFARSTRHDWELGMSPNRSQWWITFTACPTHNPLGAPKGAGRVHATNRNSTGLE